MSYRRSRANCVGSDVVTGEVSSRLVYRDRKMKHLASWNQNSIVVVASAMPVTVGVMIETWLCEFLLSGDYDEEQVFIGN
ncbi:hypothetical protein DY000_02004899 [Brassica cretica]|nr:hypothetical protein DY000_02004899 [Brassica cretica]